MSKLRNILLIICQVLLLTSCAMILAKPYFADEQELPVAEQIILIDASASMNAVSTSGTPQSRFERAVTMVEESLDTALADGGLVSIMLVDNNPRYLIQRANIGREMDIRNVLNYCVDPDSIPDESPLKANPPICTFGSPNIEAAMNLCEDILMVNPYAEVYFYTDTEYRLSGDIKVVSVRSSYNDEWNAAILDGRVSKNELNTYRFEIDIATYGREENFEIVMTVNGANAKVGEQSTGEVIQCTFPVAPIEGITQTIMLPQDMYTLNADGVTYTLTKGDITVDDVAQDPNLLVEIYTYDNVKVELRNISGGALNDSISSDDSFWFYGGKKNSLKIEYCTTLSNPFAQSMVNALQTVLSSKWNYTMDTKQNTADYLTEGYDVYIFEHALPQILPTDGVVILLDPAGTAPAGSGLVLQEKTGENGGELTFYGEKEHDIMFNISPETFVVTKYVAVSADENYQILMRCQDDPVALVNERERVFIFSYNVHYAQGINIMFPILLGNVCNFFYPETVSGYLFEVGDSVEVNAIGDEVTITSYERSTYYEFPLILPLNSPGQYTVEQYRTSIDTSDSANNGQLMTNFYVKLPASESNINAVEAQLENPIFDPPSPQKYMDEILMYFAIALVVLLVAEWWLQSRSQF